MPSDPFEPPRPIPEPLPPNRVSLQSALRTLAVWFVVILLLLAVHHIFSGQTPPRANVVPSPVDVAPAVVPMSWLIPVFTYGSMIVALVVLRAKLPERFRQFELSTYQAKPSAVDDPKQRASRLNFRVLT